MPGDFPKFLSIQTTSFCNGRCIFCPAQEVQSMFGHKMMQERVFRKIIDECAKFESVERLILYLNNEPLTDPHLVERINYAKTKVPWASVHLLTNGSLLSADKSEELIDSRLDWIGFSFQGIKKDTYEKVMGLDYIKTLDNVLKFIKKAGKKRKVADFVMLTFLGNKYLGSEEKEEAVNFWKSHGIERISYFESAISRAGNVKNLPSVSHNEIHGCNSIWANQMIHIVENGDVIACCMDWKREVILGNILRQSVSEVWNSSAYASFRGRRDGLKASAGDFICKRCEAAATLPAAGAANGAKPTEGQPDILMVKLPVWGVDMPPLGLASIVSHLNSAGIKAQPLDLNIEVFHRVGQGLKKLWDFSYAECWDDGSFFTGIKGLLEEYIEYCVERILAFDVRVIGFSVYSPNRFFTIEVIRRLKKIDPSRVIIVGGRGVATPAERGIFPEQSADYFVVGEGEGVLANWLTKSLKHQQVPDRIPGILEFKERLDEVGLFINDDLDKIAFPDYRGFALEKYRQKALPILLSRGCVSRCAFCNDWRLIGRFRQRKASEVTREIEHHIKEYGITHFCFNDPAINGNPEELERLCDLVIDKKLSITWIALAIPVKGLEPDLLKKMKRAGCLTLNFGVESGSDKILHSMRKLFTSQEAQKVLKDTRAAGINTQINFIFGFPGETEKEFSETLDFIRNNKEDICGVTNLNTCNAVFGSDLSLFPERFGITFPEEQLLRDSGWECGSQNTSLLRKQRAEKAIALLKESGIELFTSNVTAKDKERNKKLVATLKQQKTGSPDILILMCPMWATDMPALGISYLFAFLRQRGLSPEVMDINMELFRRSAEKELWNMQNYRTWNDRELFQQNIIQRYDREIDRFVQRILHKDPLSIGFSVNAGNLLFSLELARRIKARQPEKTVIFGGPHVKWFKHDIASLDKYKDFYGGFYPGLVDIFISGEAEEPLVQVLDALKSNAPLEKIPNTIIYKDRKHEVSPQTTYVNNLDDLAFPDFSWAESGDYTSQKYPILLGRGCIRKCAFCNDTFVSERFRTRSASNVLSEILFRIREKGVCHFEFCDLILNGNLKELESLCDLIIGRKLDITWSGQMAIREGMSEALFSKLRAAGFSAVTFGLESFSSKVLALMNKPYDFDLAFTTIKNAAKSGIAAHVNIVAGFPGESEEDFLETVSKLKKLNGYLKGISSLAPCLITLGSDLERNQGKYGIIMPEKEGYFRWYTKDGNNYDLRKRRAKTILETAGKIGMQVGIVNLYDEEAKVSTDKPVRDPKRKTDILLVTLPPWGVDSPPIGLGYLEAYVRSKGLNPRVMDLNVIFHNAAQDDYKKLWHLENKNYWSNDKTFPLLMEVFKKELERAVKEIVASDAELIGFSVVDPKEKITTEVINRVREVASGKKIILGGPACSTEEQRDFFTGHVTRGIDYFVVGEGEETLYQIIKNGGTNAKNNILPGLAIKKNGKWSHLAREPIQPLDSIPFPDYQGFSLASYVSKRSLLVEWSRGCLGRCSFCKNYRLTSGYRFRSAEHIMEEIRTLVSKYGIKEFTVCDNLLNGNIAQLRNVCESVIRENIIIEWSGQIAPRKEMDLDLFSKMYRAGCRKIQIGVESGSDSVLKAMRKIYSSAIAEKNIRLAKKSGMEVEIFVMIGFPGEGQKEFKKTCDFLIRNRKFIDRVKSINTLHLIAGTDIYEHYRDYGLAELPEQNWHYLWSTRDGNTYQLRKARAQALLDLATTMGLRVMETNIQEGKEKELHKSLNVELSLDSLKQQINRLQQLPGIPQHRKIRIMPHAFYKFLLLGGIFFYSLFYIFYFWVIKKIKGKSILGEE